MAATAHLLLFSDQNNGLLRGLCREAVFFALNPCSPEGDCTVRRIADLRNTRRIGADAKSIVSIAILLLTLISMLAVAVQGQILYGTLTGNVIDKFWGSCRKCERGSSE